MQLSSSAELAVGLRGSRFCDIPYYRLIAARQPHLCSERLKH